MPGVATVKEKQVTEVTKVHAGTQLRPSRNFASLWFLPNAYFFLAGRYFLSIDATTT